MVKTTIHSFEKMNKDFVEGKNPSKYYYDAHNIRFITNEEVITGGFSFEKGNDKIVTIPQISINFTNKIISYGSKTLSYKTNEINQTNITVNNDISIIGDCVFSDGILLFTTNNLGLDCIWLVNDETYDVTLLYLRNFEFSTSNLIQTIGNFENQNINKVYWVDNKSQMRFINIHHSIENQDIEDLIDMPVNATQMTGQYNLSQPLITGSTNGGIHTAGRIQYAYNLYRLNSSQTKISPLSELFSLDKNNLGGGDLNEYVGEIPIVKINNIDLNYSHIKIYAIKYTSYNQLPSINLIEEREIPTSGDIELFDDGNVISPISLSEFLFLGSDIIIPKNINSKDNRMFFAGYKEIDFDVDLDFRAYSFNSSGISVVHDNLFLDISGNVGSNNQVTIDGTNYDDPILNKFSAINLDYDTYKFQKNGTTLGAEGKHIKFELTQKNTKKSNERFFKDEEIYRAGIQLYNSFGQLSFPKWCFDFKARKGNLSKLYNTLKVTLKPEFYIWLNNPSNFPSEYDKPTGYKILIAERTSNDKTIVANGIVSTMMINDKGNIKTTIVDNPNHVHDKSEKLPKLPTFFIRNLKSDNDGSLNDMTDTSAMPVRNAFNNQRIDTGTKYSEVIGLENLLGTKSYMSAEFFQFNSMLQLFSPETIFKESFSLTSGLRLRIKGAYKNNYNASWFTEYNIAGANNFQEAKVFGGISPYYSSNQQGDAAHSVYMGLISHRRGSNPNRMGIDQYYRSFGVSQPDTSESESGNIIQFTNALSPNLSPNIKLDSNSEGLQAILNPNNELIAANKVYKITVTYTISPNLGFETVNYKAYIKQSKSGGNYEEKLNVFGTQTISTEYIYAIQTDDLDNKFEFESFLKINPDLNLDANVNLEVLYEEIGATTNVVISDDYTESLLNPININNVISSVVPEDFYPATNNYYVDIYGVPELNDRGQGFRSYNNDSKYRYTNSLESVLTDGQGGWDDTGSCNRKIISVNSYVNRNITLVTGQDSKLQSNWLRPQIEEFLAGAGITGNDYCLIAELVKSNAEIYLGNLYGGNSFEDKKRTNYIEVGNIQDINNNTITIDSPGDTFVEDFKFQRVMKTDIDVKNQCKQQVTEIIDVPVETTVDLLNRNDESFQPWDTKFQVKNEDYHKYNKVYSQVSNLIIRRDLNFNFKKVKNFENNIISSKLKTAGEIIDNWTDIQQNEILTMDGKYGPINGIISYKDNLFTFQDRAIAFLSINPRVQVQGADGLEIQLGTGNILSDYKYLTTNSGSINKWGIIAAELGIYYLDALNKSFNMIGGEFKGISDQEGLHKEFLNRINIDSIKVDNPLLQNGVSIGWDKITNDVYLSVFEDQKVWTISYNTFQQGFSSTYDYDSSRYIFSKGKMMTVNPLSLNELYLNFAGDYNVFYGVQKPSSISFIINPEPLVECTFNNLEYKSEAFDSNGNEINYTWERIKAENDFQNSGVVLLDDRFNIRKTNRKWRLNIPRDVNKVNRLRNTWSKITLIADNQQHYNYRNNDIITYYNPNYKIIQ